MGRYILELATVLSKLSKIEEEESKEEEDQEVDQKDQTGISEYKWLDKERKNQSAKESVSYLALFVRWVGGGMVGKKIKGIMVGTKTDSIRMMNQKTMIMMVPKVI